MFVAMERVYFCECHVHSISRNDPRFHPTTTIVRVHRHLDRVANKTIVNHARLLIATIVEWFLDSTKVVFHHSNNGKFHAKNDSNLNCASVLEVVPTKRSRYIVKISLVSKLTNWLANRNKMRLVKVVASTHHDHEMQFDHFVCPFSKHLQGISSIQY